MTALALALTACGGGGGSGQSSGEPAKAGTGTVTVVPTVGGAVDKWNPMTNNSGMMALNVYSTLVVVGDSGDIEGYLADDWKTTPTELSFTLKDGITCSDGTKLTATDVKSSLDYFFSSPAVTSRLSSFGPGPYTVTADDATRSVSVELGVPYADAIYGFTDFFPGKRTAIICPAGIEALKKDPAALDTPDQTYGTGPYVIEDAVPGGDVTLKLRPEFAWGPGGVTAKTPGMPGRIKYVLQSNMTTRANLVKSGEVNLSMISGPDVARLTSDKSLAHKQLAAQGVNPMYINQAPGRVGSDIKVRQALITAIDPKQYLTALQQPGELSSSIVTDNVPCYNPATKDLAPTPSVDDARGILEDAGWAMEDGVLVKDGKQLTLDFPVQSGYGTAAEYMTDAFTKMGAKVNLRQMDSATWITEFTTGKFDVTVLNNVLDPPTVALAAVNYASKPAPDGTNYSGVQQWETYQGYINQTEALDGDAACGPVEKLQEELWTNWNLLPLYAPIADFFGNGVDLDKFVNRNLSVFSFAQLQ